MEKDKSTGIWVYAEVIDGKISDTAFELLAKSQDLKEKLNGETITAVIFGETAEQYADELFAYGAEEVIAGSSPNLKSYSPRPYKEALVSLCEKYKPSILLLPASANGRDLAPRAMAKLQTGLTGDVIDLDINEDGVFVQTKPAYGGSVLTHIAVLKRRPQMVTVHPKAFDPNPKKEGATGRLIIEELDIQADDSYQLLETKKKEAVGRSITETDTLVVIGRGVKSQDEIANFEELAELLDGELAVTRPLVDLEWMPHEKQIGQSGTPVKPKFILNIAISGSAQYTTGMDKSEIVMTINHTPGVSMFDYSHYGAVADYREVIPALMKELKKRKEQ